jgi:hypothetical protein
MKKILCLVSLLIPLSGCADRSGINTAIMENNRANREAMADGLAACGDNAACQVGVTAAYFSSAGQQPLIPEETALDYTKAILPFAQLGLQAFGMYWYGQGNGTSGDRASTFVKGDGNVFVSGNKMDYSSIGLDTSFSRTFDGGYNRNFTGQQPISDEGLQ